MEWVSRAAQHVGTAEYTNLSKVAASSLNMMLRGRQPYIYGDGTRSAASDCLGDIAK